MPKVNLEYNLPEELEAYKSAMNGEAAHCILRELDNFLRSMHKYEDKETVDVQEVRSKIAELCNEAGVELWS